MRKLLAFVALALAAGCTVHQSNAPSASGPAEVGLSLKMTANPDHVVQDGSQSARVTVTAFDSAGNPIAVQVRLSGNPVGYGTLSADTVTTTTDASKPVAVTYIPPVSTTGSATTVTISAVLIGPNAAVSGSNQQVSVSAIPATNLSSAAPSAVMTASPVAPASALALNKPISLDASASCGTQKVGGVCPGTSAIVTYTWNFGDGSATATGVTVQHIYTAAGTYSPAVTVVNDRGLQASATQTLTLAAVASPTASFVVSPSTVKAITGTENYNGIASSAASGHSIVQYAWNFGDGSAVSAGSSPTAQHVYGAVGTYVTTLTVTDDVGQSATVSASITVN